jgi:transposase-like protein
MANMATIYEACKHPRRRWSGVRNGNACWACPDCFRTWENDYERSTVRLRLPVDAPDRRAMRHVEMSHGY